MPLTMNAILDTLTPIHAAIAEVNNRELTAAGTGLHHFVETRQKSIQPAPETMPGIEDQDEITRLKARLITLETHQSALTNFIEELKPRIQTMWDMGGVHSWVVQNRCRDAIETLSGLAARNNLSSPETSGLQHLKS